MSAKLAKRVLESALSPQLKRTASALALFADEDGSKIFPSVDRLAWLIGKAPRHIREDIRELRNLGVLVPTSPMRVHERTGLLVPVGGRHGTTHYRMECTALPAREPWRSRQQGRSRHHFERQNPDAAVAVSTRDNPDAGVTVSDSADLKTVTEPLRQRVTSQTERMTLASPDRPEDRSGDRPSNTAAPPRSSLADDNGKTPERYRAISREPAPDKNHHVIVRIAHQVMDETGLSKPSPDLNELIKQRCAQEGIAYAPPDVRPQTLGCAVASACCQRTMRAALSRTNDRVDGTERRPAHCAGAIDPKSM